MLRSQADIEEQDHDRDCDLMTEVRAGDRAALAELYDRHASAMFGIAVRILADAGDAEDLVHDVFVEAWRKAETWSAKRGNVRSWLMIRVRSRAIDRTRSLGVARRHAQSERVALPVSPVSEPGSDPSLEPDRRRARAALAGLSVPQRSVVELAYFEGFSFSEIADHCSIPIGTVKSRMAAGLRALRPAFDAGEKDSHVE